MGTDLGLEQFDDPPNERREQLGYLPAIEVGHWMSRVDAVSPAVAKYVETLPHFFLKMTAATGSGRRAAPAVSKARQSGAVPSTSFLHLLQ